MAGLTSGEIRRAQEAVVRTPNAPQVIQGAVEDIRAGSIQEGLEKAAMRAPSFRAMENLAQNNFGHVDAQGQRQFHGQEQVLNNQAIQTIQNLRELHSRGWENLPVGLQQQLWNQVRVAILNSQDLGARFSGMTPNAADQEAGRMAREYLRDPNFRNKVVQMLTERADIAKPISDTVTDTAAKLEAASTEQRRLTNQQNGDLVRANTVVTNATDRLRQYQEDPNPPAQNANQQVNHGRFYQELNQQIVNRDTARTTITTLESNTIPNHEGTIRQLQNEETNVLSVIGGYDSRRHPNPNYIPQQPPIPNDPSQWMTPDQYLASIGMRTLNEIRNARTQEEAQLRTARQSLGTEKTNQSAAEARINQINDEKGRAEQALKDANTARDNIQTRVNELDTEINQLNTKFLKDQGERERQQSAWVGELESIITDASNERVRQEMTTAISKVKERLDEESKTSKDRYQKDLLSRLSRRYFNARNEPQRITINNDFNQLMHPGGEVTFNVPDPNNPNALVQRRIFLNGDELALARVMGVDGVAQMTPQQQQEVYDRLNDADFRSAMAPKVAQEILTARLMTGKLSRNEVIAIERSTWGPGMVAKALEGKQNLQAAVDNLIGKGVLDWRSNLGEQLKKIDWQKFIMILLVLAGIGGGFAFLGMK